MRLRHLMGFLVALAGCAQPPAPVLQPGDTVQPRLTMAPEAPWPVGSRLAIGLSLEAIRPGREEPVILLEKDIPPGRVAMQARVIFFNGDSILGEPLEVPFVHEC